MENSLLLTDGLNRSGQVGAFAMRMEDVFWCYNVLCPNNEFAGFRGPAGLGGPSPGFDVLNGQVVNLRGGVFGAADFPFADFWTDVRLPFPSPGSCTGLYCGNSPNSFWTIDPLGAFGGSMTVMRVPEPATIGLLVLGLAGLVIARRRSGSPTCFSS